MANIKKYTTKNGEKRYYFRLYLGIDPLTGKKKQTTRRGFRTQKEAKIEISKLQLQLANDGELKKQSKMTFQNVYDEFLEGYKLSVRESTFLTCTNKMTKGVLPYFKKYIINEITASIVQKYVNTISKRYAKSSNVASAAKRIFTFAYKRGYIDKNPFDMIIMPMRHPKKKLPNFYTKDELKTFFSLPYFEDSIHLSRLAFFRTLAFSGIRKGEAIALLWSDLNFKTKKLTINKTIAQGTINGRVINKPKTVAGNRIIVLDDKTISILRKWYFYQKQVLLSSGISIDKSNQYMFSIKNNHPLALVSPNMWLDAIYKTGNIKHITVHGFRHTHASILFMSGVSVKAAQYRLGHATPEMTLNVYTHISSNQADKEMIKLDKYADF